LKYLGNKEILNGYKLAFFCSQKCPSDVIIKSYDLAIELREKGICVISGFHTQIERDVLHYLLKGKQPVIICPARNIGNYRIPSEHKDVFNQNRILYISNFDEKDKRINKELSYKRNKFVVDIADEIFISYAGKASITEKTMEYATSINKTVTNFENIKIKL
jgi:predicted Rossmann fold nucleotide-binding protein DprA/Smf involved in DNA uptake